jgi:hypothetical protein
MRKLMQRVGLGVLALLVWVSVAQAQTSATDKRQAIYQDAQRAHWFVDGDANAAHSAYVLMEPNCWYCQQLYLRIAPLLASGELRVRWVVGAFLQATSQGKAATILQAKQPALILRNELGNGNIRGAATIEQQTKRWLVRNNNFVGSHGLYTPAIIYKTADQQYRVAQGLLSDSALREIVSTMQRDF